MSTLLTTVAGAFCLFCAAQGEPEGCSYLCTPLRDADGVVRAHLVPYVPHEGDLIFYADDSKLWRFLYALAFTGPPYHVGIVVALPDGSPVLLEAGPDDSRQVYLLDISHRLPTHQGPVWARRLRCPLSPEQSAQLTRFALAQEGKRFATLRTALEITPLRRRGPIRSQIFGNACSQRKNWFCSELVADAAVLIGLLDARVVRPSVTFPKDLFTDRVFDVSCVWEKPAPWSACPFTLPHWHSTRPAKAAYR